MDKHICKICNQEVDADNHFWKNHRIKQEDYFHSYFPRYSKETGELIKFKSRDFYLHSDFNDKKEMMAWFKANPDKAQAYAIELLKKRRDRKGLVYAPSQVELRSLMLPSMIWFKKHFDNYAKLCFSIGLKPRFTREDEIINYGTLSDHSKIMIDTREQKPLKFDVPTEVATLSYGDYALFPNKFKVHIERKNLSDFVGTLGVGFERFCREIEKAKKDHAYLVILVESLLSDALSFNYLPQTKYCKVGPDFIFHNVRDIMQTYSNVQFLFCGGRKDAVQIIKKIFAIKRHPKHFDLQYYMDSKQL